MNIATPRTAVIGVGKDGSEAARQLICDGTIETCLTELDTGEYKSALELPGVGDLVFVVGTMEPEEDFQAQLSSALSALSRETLNVAVINTVNSGENSKQCSLDTLHKGIMPPVDAYFTLNMTPRLFYAGGGRARINALSNAVRIIVEMMTVTDSVMISFDDFKYIMAEAGQLWLSTGTGSGKDRAIEAARSALTDSFLDNRLVGARKILLRVVGGDDLLLDEFYDVLDTIRSNVKTDDIIFGVARKSVPEPVIQVSLIAIHFSAAKIPSFV